MPEFRKKAESGVGVDEVLEDIEDTDTEVEDIEEENLEEDILDIESEDWDESSEADTMDDLFIDIE